MPSTNDTTASTSPVTATVPCPHACHQLWPTMALHHTSPPPFDGCAPLRLESRNDPTGSRALGRLAREAAGHPRALHDRGHDALRAPRPGAVQRDGARPADVQLKPGKVFPLRGRAG